MKHLTSPLPSLHAPELSSWQKVWRNGVSPLLSNEALTALATALKTNDPRLVQGQTCDPLPLQVHGTRPCRGACVLAFCGFAEGLTTVDEIEEFWARLVHEIDARLGAPSLCQPFLNWFDTTDRPAMRKQLLREVELALSARQPIRAA